MSRKISLEEWQILEYYKCWSDPIYFIENYVWIEHKETGKVVQLKMYDYQQKLLGYLVEKKNVLILKSRRVGMSTVIAAYVTWLINFRKGIQALLISITEEKAKSLLKKVKFNLFNLKKHDREDFNLALDASWMVNTVVVNNVQFLGIGWLDDAGNVTSMSEVASLTTTETSGRGDSAYFIFIDELAALRVSQEELMASARLTTTRGGHWVAGGTPEGAGDVFHSMCMRAERGENESYEYLKVHWSDAEMTERMVKAATEGLTEETRLQEFEMEFLLSGDPVFNPLHLASCYKPVEEFPEVQDALDAFAEKVNKNNGALYYFSGVDTAYGKLNKKDSRRDYHCFTTLTKTGIQAYTYYTKNEYLSEWAGSIEEVSGFGTIHMEGTVSKLHRQYPGFLQIEDNGPGSAVLTNHRLPDDGYSQANPINTNTKTKSRLINQLVLAVETHSIVITDKFTYQCMLMYQRGTIPGQYQAPAGDHYDDTVMALAFAYDALLQHGALEFPWGATADDLRRIEQTQEYNERVNIDRTSYGPTLFNTKETSQRISELFEDNLSYADFVPGDLEKVQPPSFGDNYGNKRHS